MKNTKKILIVTIAIIVVIALYFFVIEYKKARETEHLTPDEFKIENSIE